MRLCFCSNTVIVLGRPGTQGQPPGEPVPAATTSAAGLPVRAEPFARPRDTRLPSPATSHAGVRTAPRDRVGRNSRLLFQAEGPQALPRGTDGRNPLSRAFCPCHPQTQPAGIIGQLDEQGRLPSRPEPGSPQPAAGREPGTNLSPVTGSILLRVSRSMTESNGTFRKNTLWGENSTTVSQRGPRPGLGP